MEAGSILVTGVGLAVAAGLHAYIPLLIAGLLIRFDVVTFGQPFDLLGSTPALLIVGVVLVVELVADKVPAVDAVNDAVQPFMRPLSGAVLFAGSVTGIDPDWSEALGLVLGLGIAAAVGAATEVARPTVGPASAGHHSHVVTPVEDAFSAGLAVAALLAPLVALALLAGVAVWLVARLRRRHRGPGAVD